MWVGSSWRVDGHLSVSRAIGEALFRSENVVKMSTPFTVTICTNF